MSTGRGPDEEIPARSRGRARPGAGHDARVRRRRDDHARRGLDGHVRWSDPGASSTSTTSYIFLGDRWNAGNLADSRYVWEPLSISGTTVSMTCQTSWTIDTATGTGTVPAYYRLTARHSGKVVDVINASTANSAEVKQWSWNGGSNQRWAFEDAGGGYFRLINLNSGKCLDVASASTADGANVIQYTCGSGTNQQWSRTQS